MKLSRRHFLHLAAGAAALPAAPQIAWAQAPSAPATLSPTGKLRVALIASNPVLVTRGTDGSLSGVSVSVARTLAARLGVPVELKPYDNPVRYNESLASDDWGLLHAIHLAQNTSRLA
jgi:polar amino acid transport system substrate-binding protein